MPTDHPKFLTPALSPKRVAFMLFGLLSLICALGLILALYMFLTDITFNSTPNYLVLSLVGLIALLITGSTFFTAISFIRKALRIPKSPAKPKGADPEPETNRAQPAASHPELASEPQTPQDQPPSPDKPKPSRKSLALIIAFIFFTVISITFIYAYQTNALHNLLSQQTLAESFPWLPKPKPTPTPSPLPSPTPSISPSPSAIQTTPPSKLVMGSLHIPLPNNWQPYLSQEVGPDFIYYLAGTPQETDQILACIDDSSCNTYPLILSISGSYPVPQDKTHQEYIASIRPEFDLTRLKSTTIDGHTAYMGLTNPNQFVLIIIVPNSQNPKGSVQIIQAYSSNTARLQTLKPSLLLTRINTPTSKQPGELVNTRAFQLTYQSQYDPPQISLYIDTINNSFLATPGDNTSYTYILYSNTTQATEEKVGGPDYPTDELNSTFQLLTDNINLRPGIYGTDQIKIEIKSPDDSGLPAFLQDPTYCVQDSDCKYRSNFCTLGAFNPYHIYRTPWGCGPPTLQGFTEDSSCFPQPPYLTFDSISCVSNRCQLNNPQPVCGQDPSQQ